MNNVNLLGRLTADPMLRYTTNQTAVVTFTLAVPRRKQKDQEQETDYFYIVAWRKTAEFVNKYIRKGLRVAISGHLQNRSYEDKQGNRRQVTEVIADGVYFADAKAAGSGAKTSGGTYDNYNDHPKDNLYSGSGDSYGDYFGDT